MKKGLAVVWCVWWALSLAFVGPVGDRVEPTGDPRALKGGQISIVMTDFPKSFNYYVNNSSDAALVFGFLYETLAELDPKTLEYQPLLAESWTISPDKKVFTFKMNPKARWADGSPVTAWDVRFTYDTIMDPKNLTSTSRIALSRFYPPKVVDARTIIFTAKNVHFKNFIALAGLAVLPKKLFAGKDFNKDFNLRLPPGSGPYTLSEVKEGRYYTLSRRKDYWGEKMPLHIGTNNFDRIKVRIISNDQMAFEAFKKGDFDLFVENMAKRWVKGTSSPGFRMNWIVKRKIFNYEPQGFQGLVFNLRRPFFKDVRVRKAICMLQDRKTLLKKLMFDQYAPLRSYWPSINIVANENPEIEYDPAAAEELLIKAGYNRVDRDGFLINAAGRRAEFTIAYTQESWERYLTVFKEDCAKAGVKVNLDLISWATLLKRAERYDFDSTVMAWSGELFPDPEGLWYSKHADEIGGANYPGYKNPLVDKLIDSMAADFDARRREETVRKIDALIYRDYPYALQWGANYERIYYWNKFGMPRTIYSRISDWSGALTYWWYDPARAARLREAMARKEPLPKEEENVYYDAALKRALVSGKR